MATSPSQLQKADQNRWHGFDEKLRELGIYGGLPYGLLEYQIETRQERLRVLIDTCLDIAEGMNLETWRTKQAKNTPKVNHDWQLTNSWTSSRPRGTIPGDQVRVWVYKHNTTGRARVDTQYVAPETERLSFLVNTHDIRWQSSFANAEIKARERLIEELTPTQQISYLMSDCFIEQGKQSGNSYIVRKNRPTIAFGSRDQPLCALCLHPLGYYTASWAGVMVPSDEVWTHLNYIRTDELRYWRRANQIPLRLANSGV